MATPNPKLQYPAGYNPVPAGDYKNQHIDEFGAKKTRVTNKEWGEVVSKLGSDRFILLKQDEGTGDVTIVT